MITIFLVPNPIMRIMEDNSEIICNNLRFRFANSLYVLNVECMIKILSALYCDVIIHSVPDCG